MKQENTSRPFMERRKEFKKYRYSEIDSHSLRNLYKSIIEKENSDPTSDEKITKDTLDSLHDWVNRRITGYLIFRNTISENDDEELKHSSELGIHANHHIGQKWKQLTTKEKKEYQDLARSYRKLFKEEVIIPENYSDLIELLETVDVKIKKIKKEE